MGPPCIDEGRRTSTRGAWGYLPRARVRACALAPSGRRSAQPLPIPTLQRGQRRSTWGLHGANHTPTALALFCSTLPAPAASARVGGATLPGSGFVHTVRQDRVCSPLTPVPLGRRSRFLRAWLAAPAGAFLVQRNLLRPPLRSHGVPTYLLLATPCAPSRAQEPSCLFSLSLSHTHFLLQHKIGYTRARACLAGVDEGSVCCELRTQPGKPF